MNIPKYIDPEVPASELTLEELEMRAEFMKSVKNERNSGNLSCEAYDEVADLFLG